jgi:hypothetical protein
VDRNVDVYCRCFFSYNIAINCYTQYKILLLFILLLLLLLLLLLRSV